MSSPHSQLDIQQPSSSSPILPSTEAKFDVATVVRAPWEEHHKTSKETAHEIFDEMKQLAADFQMWLQARRRFEDSNAMTEFNRVLSYIEEEEAAQESTRQQISQVIETVTTALRALPR